MTFAITGVTNLNFLGKSCMYVTPISLPRCTLFALLKLRHTVDYIVSYWLCVYIGGTLRSAASQSQIVPSGSKCEKMSVVNTPGMRTGWKTLTELTTPFV